MEELEQTTMDLYPLMRHEFHKLTSVDYPEMDWGKLMEIVEFIENIDDTNRFDTWESKLDNGRIYKERQFQGYYVQIERKTCWIFVELTLDPSQTISRVKSYSKFDAVLNACYEFALKRNNNEI